MASKKRTVRQVEALARQSANLAKALPSEPPMPPACAPLQPEAMIVAAVRACHTGAVSPPARTAGFEPGARLARPCQSRFVQRRRMRFGPGLGPQLLLRARASEASSGS